jgi:hypothetical protein
MLIRQRHFGYKTQWISSWKDNQNPQSPARRLKDCGSMQIALTVPAGFATEPVANPIDLGSEKMIGASGHFFTERQ